MTTPFVKTIRVLLLSIGFMVLHSIAFAQSEVSYKVVEGKVIEGEAEESIDQADVYVAGTTITTKTDKHGHYHLEVPDSLLKNQNITICCHAPGYDRDSSSVKISQPLIKVNMVLEQSAVRLKYD